MNESTEILLLEKMDVAPRGDQISLGFVPQRAEKRKAAEDYGDASAGSSKIRHLKVGSSENNELPIIALHRLKSIDHLKDDKTCITAVKSGNDSEDENGSRIMLMHKNDWNFSSVKEDEKGSENRQFCLSLPQDSDPVSPVDGHAQETTLPEQDDLVRHRHPSTDKCADPVRNVWVTSKADKIQLKEKGHTWRTGKWKREEIALLKENVDNFCRKNNITDPHQMIFDATKDERKDFYPTISQGLNRPVFAVYRKVKRMYDTRNYRGKYTEEEVKRLKNLYAKYGKVWTVIGQEMGRSSDSVKDRCRLFLENERVIGKWTEEEEERLAAAVYAQTGEKPGTSITGNISWGSVADLVEKRTEKQCRAKWLNYLNWKLCRGDEWTKTNDRLLIERLLSLNIMSEDDIPWKKLSDGLTSSRSPQWLRSRWWNLKKLYLSENPDVTSITLTDLLEQLSDIISKQILHSWQRSEAHYNEGAIVQNENTYATDISGHLQQAAHDEKTNDQDKVTGSPAALEQQTPISDIGQSVEIMQSYIDGTSKEQKDIQDVGEVAHNTIQLTPTSTAGFYFLQSSETNHPVAVFLSDNIDSTVNITLSPEVLSLLNRGGKSETDGEDHSQDPSSAGVSIDESHNDVITTSDVLVYQETVNDDNVKNPVLSSTIQQVGPNGGTEEDDCFMQASSSPLQGTLLEGTDLATATIRIDGSR